jgi:hypothetical protein
VTALAALADEVVSHEPEPLRWSLRGFCGEHAHQWRFASSRARRRRLKCARQSGKTQGCDGLMLDRGLEFPGSWQILIGLNGVAVRQNNWIPVWQRALCDKYHVERKDNEAQMISYFPNGTRAMFMGSDDLRHLKNLLGNRLPRGSTVIIDEAQDQSDDILDYLHDTVLPPMVTPETVVIEAGVRPDVPAGRFYEHDQDTSWEQHSWARADNVHTPEAMETLRLYLADKGLTFADLECDLKNPPEHVKRHMSVVYRVLRDWMNRDVYDPNETTYHYDAIRNGYTPELPEWARGWELPPGFGRVMVAKPWPGIDTFSVAIDPGGDDPFGLVVLGWGKAHRRIQHVLDWVSPRDARLTWGQVMREIGKPVAEHFKTVNWCYDTNSDTELDTFGHQYNVPVIRAAKKSDMAGQIRRNNDLLEDGVMAVMDGSNLATDYARAKFKDGAWQGFHPTASECGRYALGAYWLKDPAPPKAVAKLDPFDKEAKRMAEQLKRARR